MAHFTAGEQLAHIHYLAPNTTLIYASTKLHNRTEEPEKYHSEGNPISVQILREFDGEPHKDPRKGTFGPEDDLLYYDGNGDGYIAKSDIEAIINVNKLVEEDLDLLKDSLDTDLFIDGK
jgi:hypothetical protein